MLTYLRIHNLALADDIEINFAQGLNAITGETGTGKSILIGALNLLLGERADKTLIRSGEKKSVVEAQFQLKAPQRINTLLEQHGVTACNDGCLVIRRIIKTNGAGQNFINDHTVTLNLLSQIGNRLVDFHGAYEHQSLLRSDTQRELLDSFGNLQQIRKAYLILYRELKQIENLQSELSGSSEEFQQELELLSFRVQEIETACLHEDEENSLLEEHGLQSNACRIHELAEKITFHLTEADSSSFFHTSNAFLALKELSSLLPNAECWKEEIEGISTQLQELSATIRSQTEVIEINEARLQWLDERLATYDRIKRKYGGSVERVQDLLATSQERLKVLSDRANSLKKLQDQWDQKNNLLKISGQKLTDRRKETARELSPLITQHLNHLGFPQGAFDIKVLPTTPGLHGMDEIEFGFAPNVGEPMHPLLSIASSGEISRVMLALKATLASQDQVPVLIFDEIDANIGGEIGSAIGEKMKAIAHHHQVITITHLPQVAVSSKTHFAVFKEVLNGRTYTKVSEVKKEARAKEIARMLGGKSSSKLTLQHAQEMLK